MKPVVRTEQDLSKFASGIRKSGFPLEYQTALTLKRAGWSVISSKYYLDDTTQTPREIDLIAYKVTKLAGFQVYTTLIVSCKKSENETWALLSREADRANPNTDWWPLHLWSNNKAIDFQITKPGEKRRFHHEALARGVQDALTLPAVELFAFQIMNSASGNVHNDKPIYDSIASLVQAQAYELSALPDRRKEPSVYQFNLLTVLDADLIRLHFDEDRITPVAVDSEHYIARYIVQKRQSFSRIHFIRASAFAEGLSDYDRLHAANAEIFAALEATFYRGVLQDTDKVALFIEQFRRKVRWPLHFRITGELHTTTELESMDVSWNGTFNRADVEVYAVSVEIIDFLNSDPKSKEIVANALKSVYRYVGPFEFNEGIPF